MSGEVFLGATELASELTIAWLGNRNNRVGAEDVSAFLRTIHTTITGLAGGYISVAPKAVGEMEPARIFIPAVTERMSLASKDHILSLINGKPYKMLRRHLSSYGLTPEEYRARYKLKPDYPMVSEAYSAVRRKLAHKIGLGSNGRQAKVPAPSSSPKSAGANGVRAPKSDAVLAP